MRGQQTFGFKEAIVGVFRPGTENVELEANLKLRVPQRIGGRISSRDRDEMVYPSISDSRMRNR